MEKSGRCKQFLSRHFKSNPLSYLGWLGVLGLLGVFFVPVFIPFLLCFSFFGYTNMVADELFWANVHKASTRAFWAVFIFDVLVGISMFIRGMTIGAKSEGTSISIEGNLVSMGVFTFDQYAITFFAFFISITLMLLVFTISMMQFRRREKKLLREA